jgi:putative redox protein
VSIDVSLTWLGGLKFNAQVEDRHMQLNSAEEMQSAFSPMELFLISLAGCTAFDVQLIMEKQRQKINRFEVAVHGMRREEDPRYYESIDLEYFLEGDNIRKDAVERAVRLSQEKYCSVRAMIKDAVKIRITYRISNSKNPEEKYVYQ